MLASKAGLKSAQTRFSLLLLEDGEFFLDVRHIKCRVALVRTSPRSPTNALYHRRTLACIDTSTQYRPPTGALSACLHPL